MNERDLSQKLEELAKLLLSVGDVDYRKIMEQVAEELLKLSNENYAPGNSLSWNEIKPKPITKPKGGFISNTGKKLPF